jgi:L-fuconolactonase
MMIDAHQHFWRLDRGDYEWLTGRPSPICRDFGPADLAPILDRTGIARTILVQAAASLAETEFLLELAARASFVAGVVGWADLAAKDAAATITRMAADKLLVGLRPMLQDIADDDFILRAELEPALDAMLENGLVFDALVVPRHLCRVLVFLDRHPNLTVVVDHGAKPFIRDRVLDPWRDDMAAIARRGNSFCKLSGLVTEARADWSVADLRPYVAHLLNTFGSERLIWGSDWPVVNLGGGYERWLDATRTLLGALDPAERAAVFGGNATRIYLAKQGGAANAR